MLCIKQKLQPSQSLKPYLTFFAKLSQAVHAHCVKSCYISANHSSDIILDLEEPCSTCCLLKKSSPNTADLRLDTENLSKDEFTDSNTERFAAHCLQRTQYVEEVTSVCLVSAAAILGRSRWQSKLGMLVGFPVRFFYRWTTVEYVGVHI